MGLFDFLFGSGSNNVQAVSAAEETPMGIDMDSGNGIIDDTSMGHGVNPANGLPMMDDSFDIAGNVFGTDSSDMFDSDFSSFDSGSMFDD